MYSLREYCRPERASRISPEEGVWTYRKALRVVVDNERKVLPHLDESDKLIFY